MADPVSIAALSLQILTKTTDALNALRERSQRTKDTDIKDQINTLYDNVLGLKEVVSRLLDENKELKRQLEAQQHPPEEPKIRQVGQTNYYFKGDGGPFCQPCYVKNGKLVELLPQERSEFGAVSRDCPVCQTTFYEEQDLPISQMGRLRGRRG